MTQKHRCELMTACKFFIYEMKNKRIALIFKERYCYNCKEACARYMIAKAAGMDYVPELLYPNEYEEALEIIERR